MTTKKSLSIKQELLNLKRAQLALRDKIKCEFPIGSVVLCYDKPVEVFGYMGYETPGLFARHADGKVAHVMASSIRELSV